ncbi:hypothetical protein CLAVI_000611 [Candidatus Clavichlamydia salmonicola]|uniref:hypothetical protein n=1 Tax=Candidatus Clavichlamydia salmonicola TaxID=469812 RepID=UPI0018911D8D|nr:hypothetical protein [Candidatus Clavichlamydia salmonicola]MBF5050987.1 hypothetical protein [Candidatus Clavichlamydia salmonicola]
MSVVLFVGVPITHKKFILQLSLTNEFQLIEEKSATFIGFYLPSNPCPYEIVLEESNRLQKLIWKHCKEIKLLNIVPQVITQTMPSMFFSS